jgi:pimeloyl-ACP methyl ester carboxylesterase
VSLAIQAPAIDHFVAANAIDMPADALADLKDVHLVVVEGGPHAIPWTHAVQVNTALLDFLHA